MAKTKTLKVIDVERIYLAGYPKAGNRWICRLLGRYLGDRGVLNAPATRGGGMPPAKCAKAMVTHRFVCHDLLDLPFEREKVLAYKSLWENERLAIVVRDPRDLMVSAYHWWHRHDGYQAHSSMGLDKECSLLDFFEHVFTARFAIGYGYRDFYDGWLEADPRPPFIFHEALMDDREKELRRVLIAMGIEIDAGRMKHVVGEEVGKKRATFTRGSEYPHRPSETLRGYVGEWRYHFDTEVAKATHDYCNELMYKFEYIESDDWWKGWEVDERMASGVAIVCDVQADASCTEHDSEPEEIPGLS